jgi:hypothetical protein
VALQRTAAGPAGPAGHLAPLARAWRRSRRRASGAVSSRSLCCPARLRPPPTSPSPFTAPPSLLARSSLVSPGGASGLWLAGGCSSFLAPQPRRDRTLWLAGESSWRSIFPLASGAPSTSPPPPRCRLPSWLVPRRQSRRCRGSLARGDVRSLPAYRGCLREHASHPAGLMWVNGRVQGTSWCT